MDDQAFSNLFQAYSSLMFYIAKDILKDAYLAEDIVQEAFIKVIQNPQAVIHGDEAKTRSFLCTITRNLAINLYHKNKRVISLDQVEEAYFVAQKSPSAEMAYFDAHPLDEAIRKLPALYRDVLVMAHVYEMETRQIAFYFGLKDATVRKRLERARKMLGKILEEEAVP